MRPVQAFADPVEPPDAEFGCFAAMYGPKGSGFEGQALLRADIGAGRTGRGKAMPIFIPVSRADVARCGSTLPQQLRPWPTTPLCSCEWVRLFWCVHETSDAQELTYVATIRRTA